MNAMLPLLSADRGDERLDEGVVLLRAYAVPDEDELLAAIADITADAPFRHLVTPGGYRMSVAMTNCGSAGWISDRDGYRYGPLDPATRRPWPPMPEIFAGLAARAAVTAGYPDFRPDVCLINRYEPGTRLSMHQDRDERRLDAPIVSVSLGLSAVFLFGGLTRNERARRIALDHGDVVVWGGPARLRFHGVAPLAGGYHHLTGRRRLNLTFRRAL